MTSGQTALNLLRDNYSNAIQKENGINSRQTGPLTAPTLPIKWAG